MPRVVSHARNLAIVLGLALSLGGCVVAPARPYYGGGWVASAPPPPRVEYYGVAPVSRLCLDRRLLAVGSGRLRLGSGSLGRGASRLPLGPQALGAWTPTAGT